jgi:hypothetical protein
MEKDYVKMDISTARDSNELIRMLAILRLRSDVKASSRGITEHSVLGFSEGDVNTLPETLIVHIIDDYNILRNNGVKESDIFERLDRQRIIQGHKSSTIKPSTLSEYVRQRLRIEFPHMASLEDKVIDIETIYATYWFSKASRSVEDWKKVDAFANKVIAHLHKNDEDHKKQTQDITETSLNKDKQKKKTPIATIMGAIILVIIPIIAYWLFYMDGLKFFNP